MGAGTGWELTAQYLAASGGSVFPTPLGRDELNAEIAKLHRDFVFDQACASGAAIAGKMAMGIGGINACVVSRRWTPSSLHDREPGATD